MGHPINTHSQGSRLLGATKLAGLDDRRAEKRHGLRVGHLVDGRTETLGTSAALRIGDLAELVLELEGVIATEEVARVDRLLREHGEGRQAAGLGDLSDEGTVRIGDGGCGAGHCLSSFFLARFCGSVLMSYYTMATEPLHSGRGRRHTFVYRWKLCKEPYRKVHMSSRTSPAQEL